MPSYRDHLRGLFGGLPLGVEDLYLLEAFQVRALPARAPRRELAAVLHAYPLLRRVFEARDPSSEAFFAELLAKQGPAGSEEELQALADELVWELADWLVYLCFPAEADARSWAGWNLSALTDIAPLEGRVVADIGAGPGRFARMAAPVARTVFAVEPVGALREYQRERAAKAGLRNLHVMDGMLNAIPLPENSIDVVVTARAIGWDLLCEIAETERIAAPGGAIVHLTGCDPKTMEGTLTPIHEPLLAAGYAADTYPEPTGARRRYWKRMD